MTYTVRTLAHLGRDEDSSERAVRTLLAEATRVTIPGGLVIAEIDNPRSLRGAAHGIRHPIDAVATGTVVETRGGRVSRFDTRARLLEFAPRLLDVVAVHGIRVFVAVPETLAIPLVGRLLRRLEWFARDSELLQRFGAHLLVVMRKRPAELAAAPAPKPFPARYTGDLAERVRRAADSMGSGPRESDS